MRLGSNSLVEMALDVIELAILLFAITWPGIFLTKICLRLSPELCKFIQRRYRGYLTSKDYGKDIDHGK